MYIHVHPPDRMLVSCRALLSKQSHRQLTCWSSHLDLQMHCESLPPMQTCALATISKQ